MNYSQFLQMIPEAVLVAVLVLIFIADFATSNRSERKWLNPLACLLMLPAIVAPLMCTEQVHLFGDMYRNSFGVGTVKAILAAGTLIVFIQAKAWASSTRREAEFYMLTVSTLLGMFMMLSAGHFLMFFLGLEMASVPLACVVAFDKYRNDSAEAAAKYILTATFSSGVMLYGISFLYGSIGTLYFDDIATALTAATTIKSHMGMTVLGFVFFFSGLGFKLSLVPFHFWTADTYQGAPTSVTGYLSVISKGAAAYTLLIILFHVFGAMREEWNYLLYIVIVLSITIANLFAIRQSELKRFMAFSSISQAGYIMLAAVGTDWALSASSLLYYVLIYIVANMSVFSIIAVVERNNNGKTDISDYDGFYSTNPKLSLLMTLALFSLGGIPPFAGMFSKFFVFMAAAKAGSAWAYAIVFIALINTVVSLYYYLLIVKAMYIKKSDNPLPTFRSDNNTRLALAICTAGILLFGVCSCIFDWLTASVQ